MTATVFTSTATASRKSKNTFAFGRRNDLAGRPRSEGGYIVFRLAVNYDGSQRGGLRRTWVAVEQGLSYQAAVALMNRRLGYKAFQDLAEEVAG